jgi:hypothetical protein
MRAILFSLLLCATASAAGLSPASNTDMGCTSSGQGMIYNGTNIVCQAPTRPSSTVLGLPTCNPGNTGLMYIVTNALAPVALATVAGGGAVTIGVTCNGTNWIVQ